MDETRGLLYFVQRCEELTFPYTLDSYKSPTTSLQGLAFEASSLLRDAADAPEPRQLSAKKAVGQILKEFELRLNSNWVAKQCLSVTLDELSKLDPKTSTIDQFRRYLEVVGAELDGLQYISEVVDQLISLSVHSSQKSKIDILAKEFVATLQGLGVSRDHINTSLIEFFYQSEEISSSQCLKEFCKIVYPHRHDYSVAIGVSAEIREIPSENLSALGVLRLDEGAENNGINEEARLRLQDELNSEQVVLVEVGATDYNSAVSRAKSILGDVGNFFKVFSHRSEFLVSDNAVAIQACCEGISKTVEVSANHMHYIRDMRHLEASRNFRKFHDEITLDVGPDKNKFRNVVNIHGMSLSSESPDIQLVNIWTCLETISPSRGAQSNIDAVVTALMPALMLGYTNRLVTSLLFDILRWDRRSFSTALAKADTSHLSDLRSKFVFLLTNLDSEPALEDLLNRCRDFELLRFRIYNIAMMLRSADKTKERLNRHYNLVRWQLHRIYRSRNRIIHSGVSPEFTGYLVENAHDFFDICLLFCMDLSASKNGYNTFESCFDYAQHAYDQYLNGLENGEPLGFIWSLPKRKGRSFIFDYERE